ncbi:hypothetical protein AcV7_007065 [Taiwanofungus camphoratus]|nr:hypothetical protein AcV7_007065 [Antrodia cinnamomea]
MVALRLVFYHEHSGHLVVTWCLRAEANSRSSSGAHPQHPRVDVRLTFKHAIQQRRFSSGTTEARRSSALPQHGLLRQSWWPGKSPWGKEVYSSPLPPRVRADASDSDISAGGS